MQRDPENCTPNELLKIINGCIHLLNTKYNMNVSVKVPESIAENDINDTYMSDDFEDDRSSIISDSSNRPFKKATKRKNTTIISDINLKRTGNSSNNGTLTPNTSSSNNLSPSLDNYSQRSSENQNTQSDNGYNPKGNQKFNTFSHESPSKPENIPPIYLVDKIKWINVSKIIQTEKINVTKATNTQTGIRIQPQTENDHRQLTKILLNANYAHFTYNLPSEKSLMIVIRGIPLEVDIEDIKIDLNEKGFTPAKVTRMINKRTKSLMPLILVQLPRDEKRIYNMEFLVGMSVQIETLKSTPQITQCFRCQKFGHGQQHCTANVKCVKCSGNHRAYECELTKVDQPKCANCGENHVASYRGCTKAPKLKKTDNNTTSNSQQPKPMSYAAAVAGHPPTTNNENILAQTIHNFNQLMGQMSSMMKIFQESVTKSTNHNVSQT